MDIKIPLLRLASIISLLLTGCFSTELTPLEPPSGLERLKHLSALQVPLQVETHGLHDSTAGFQYLFLALPFSRIYLPHLESDVKLQLSIAGGVRGYRFIDPTDNQTRMLRISIESVSVNGYDLIFIRKPTASVTMRAHLIDNGSIVRQCEASFEASNSAQYAFSVELQSALAEALLHASYELLDCLGFYEIGTLREAS